MVGIIWLESYSMVYGKYRMPLCLLIILPMNLKQLKKVIITNTSHIIPPRHAKSLPLLISPIGVVLCYT